MAGIAEQFKALGELPSGVLLDSPRFGPTIARLLWAGIAQLVERNLAKVEVASSSLVSRSNLHELRLAEVRYG